jgi:hypothetical protein
MALPLTIVGSGMTWSLSGRGAGQTAGWGGAGRRSASWHALAVQQASHAAPGRPLLALGHLPQVSKFDRPTTGAHR